MEDYIDKNNTQGIIVIIFVAVFIIVAIIHTIRTYIKSRKHNNRKKY